MNLWDERKCVDKLREKLNDTKMSTLRSDFANDLTCKLLIKIVLPFLSQTRPLFACLANCFCFSIIVISSFDLSFQSEKLNNLSISLTNHQKDYMTLMITFLIMFQILIWQVLTNFLKNLFQ